MPISKTERQRRIDALNALVQTGLVQIVNVVAGEPYYALASDLERKPIRRATRTRDQ